MVRECDMWTVKGTNILLKTEMITMTMTTTTTTTDDDQATELRRRATATSRHGYMITRTTSTV